MTAGPEIRPADRQSADQHSSAQTAAPAHSSGTAVRPASLKVSMALHLLAAAGLIGLAVFYAFTAEGYDPNVGPLVHGIGIVGMASLVAAAFVILGLRGTNGSRRGRTATTVVLTLSAAMLLIHPVAMLITVLPALAALVLLWLPSSTAFIRTYEARSSGQVRELLESKALSNRVPYSNLGQNFNQPPGF